MHMVFWSWQGIFLSHKVAEKHIAKYEANSPLSEVDIDCHKYRQVKYEFLKYGKM